MSISFHILKVFIEYGQMFHLLTFRDVLLFLYLVHWSCMWQRDQEEIQHDLQPVAERRSFGGCQKIPSARSLRCTTSRHTLCFPTSKGRRCVFMQGTLVKYQNIAIKDRLEKSKNQIYSENDDFILLFSFVACHRNETRMEKMGRRHWCFSPTSEGYLRLSAYHSNSGHGQVLLSHEPICR